MNASDATLDNAVFIGMSGADPVPLPFDEIVAHHAAVRDAIGESMHIEHELNPDLKSLVLMRSFVYSFNAYKVLGHLLPDLFHETGAVALRQLWEVSLNMHWIAIDPDDRSHAFCNFTLIENRKNIIKSGKGARRNLAISTLPPQRCRPGSVFRIVRGRNRFSRTSQPRTSPIVRRSLARTGSVNMSLFTT